MNRNLVIAVVGVVAAAGTTFPIMSARGDSEPATEESLQAARRATPGAAKIADLLARRNPAARHHHTASAAWARALYWTDPFSDNPRRPIPLRREVRLSMQLAAARREAADARAETATLR